MSKKYLIIFTISTALFLSLISAASYAQDQERTTLNTQDRLQISREDFGKEKFQSIIKDNNFMVKGKITASSSNSITLGTLQINIDSNTKITGNISTGMYAMAKGTITDSTYTATRIVVDNRNKEDKDEDQDKDDNKVTVTPTITPTITPSTTPTVTPKPSVTPEPSVSPTATPTVTPVASPTPEFEVNVPQTAFSSIVKGLQDILNTLTNLIK